MKSGYDINSNNKDEWNIETNIGPITFSILIDSAFFNHKSQQYSQRHRHATFEFHFITEGSGVILTDNEQYQVVPGSFYIVRAGIYHMQKGSAANPIRRYSCKFEYEISNRIFNNYSEEEIRDFVYILSNTRFYYSKNLNNIINIISEIQLELHQRKMGYYTKTQHLFSSLFISIIREIAVETEYNYKSNSSKVFQENRISIIDNFFDMNFNHKATANDLCQLIHISKSQLNRIMKEKYNMTFKQKHIETQIEHIKYMLFNTDLPIGVIAEKTGYSSEGNFTAFVKHILGVSPKNFRKLNKERT